MATHTTSPKRTLWKRVALTSSTVTLVAMASLFSAGYLKAHGGAMTIVNAGASSLNESDLSIESLSKKIAADNEEHQALQSKQTELASSVQQMPALVFTPAERARRRLASQLVRLLALEKQYPEGSPEITDTRNQIDTLQSQIADMPPTDGHIQVVVSPARASLDAQLADDEHRILLNEAQTKADVSRLGLLVRAKESAASRRHADGGLDGTAIFLFSLLPGLVAGLLVVIFSHLYSVRNEVVLRRLLPSTVELIGTIPHMRART